MTEVKERQKEILFKLTEEYIKTATPVSSETLKEKHKLNVSSATIRLDFGQLTDEGLLEKHYISGGRIPTDKAYRFFVDRIFELEDFQRSQTKILEKLSSLFQEIDDYIETSHQIAKSLASISSNFGVVFLEDSRIFWKEGWDEILKVPEFRNLSYLRSFTRLVDDLEKNIEKLDSSRQGEVEVFIGRELPFKAKDFSMVLGKSLKPKRRKSTFAVLGPKRMDFRKNISLVDCLIKQMENF